MAKIFVSYKRADRPFLDLLLPKLRRAHGMESVWFDEHIPGGVNWWQVILSKVAECDVFVFLLSNDSLRSPYCIAEFKEALRLKKPFIPVVCRLQTELPPTLPDRVLRELKKTQWITLVDNHGGIDADSMVNLNESIREILLATKSDTAPDPVEPEATPEPEVDDLPNGKKENWWTRLSEGQGIVIAAFITLIGVILTIFASLGGFGSGSTPTPTTTVPQVAIATDEVIITDEAMPTETEPPTATETPSPTETPSNTPTSTPEPLNPTQIEQSVTAEMAKIATEAVETVIANATATVVMATVWAQQTIYAQETNAANETATSALWTPSFTPDIRKTAEARFTQDAAATLTMQAIMDAYTDTPTATYTPSNTPTPTATNTLTPLEQALKLAWNFTGTNGNWKIIYPNGFVQEFNGVEMVLVAKGCFMMGSNDNTADEKPVHEQCFDAPFWIDKTEVTNAQFGSIGCEEYSSEPNQPRNCVTWFEARDFCEARDARLPTEREWEYAARGVANWVYPWGDEFVADNAVFSENSGGKTATVSSRPGGSSWVGALDMSGNLWEWTSSWYAGYPYAEDDGREDLVNSSNNNEYTYRVLRGGSLGDFSNLLRAANRDWNVPDDTNFSWGFRCLSSLK